MMLTSFLLLFQLKSEIKANKVCPQWFINFLQDWANDKQKFS